MKALDTLKSGLLLFLMLTTVACGEADRDENRLRLFYNQPAAEWTEALPLGNGFLGAMVYGTVEKEHIQFNEETLWTGKPHDYAHMGASNYLEEIRQLLFDGKNEEAMKLAAKEFLSIPVRQMAYQPFGDLYIEFPGHEFYTDYRRELNLADAVCKTSYRVDNMEYSREVIASHPHQCIVIKLQSKRKHSLNCIVSFDAEHEYKKVAYKDGLLTLEVKVKNGALRGVAGARIVTDGMFNFADGKVSISEAGSATLYLSAATNYKDFRDISNDPVGVLDSRLANVVGKGYPEIRKEHIKDYQELFNRFVIDLGSTGRDTMATDERLRNFTGSNDDPGLLALYMQYGRYLLISSSREGTQPANLQGIWNKELKPPWESKYTTNINAEMNYWPAELLNLPECHEPFFRLIEECAVTGQSIAREHYACDGWVLHHNTDIWRGAAPINSAPYGVWPTGAAWVCSHLWEHYLFTQDITFLRDRAYPLMKEAARFYSQFLVKDPKTGWLISTPSNSPENGGLVAGPTMDHQLIRSLFMYCIKSAEILEAEDEFTRMLAKKVILIAPNQIGKYGQLQEWLEDKDSPDNKHRHVSQLWGVHPGNDINWEKSPELMEAARQSLLFRGDDATGWSLGWKVNLWARFGDGNHACSMFDLLFRPKGGSEIKLTGGGSYLNLFDAHPPFQIDGNFGATAGIAEMLIQSHMSYIDLLPALPDALNTGSVAGICARGGFELAFKWAGGILGEVEVLSKAGGTCKLHSGSKKVSFDTKAGKRYKLSGDLELRSVSP
ncbi:MAG: glycoside hydrolase family 95 protein [Bacteroidetes bacterium]|nr:glycoside hydrolase family 95 protein [Bacteroidota bacterium]